MGVSGWVTPPPRRKGAAAGAAPAEGARHRVLVGNAALLAAAGVAVPPDAEAHLQSVQASPEPSCVKPSSPKSFVISLLMACLVVHPQTGAWKLSFSRMGR